MFRAGLYARVSTNDQQTLAMQNRAMREYAARRGWTVAMQVREVNSGAARREAREKVLAAARRREIDVVLVWRLDRWGRSVTDLLATLQELEHLGVGFVSLTEALDLTTPAGRAMAGHARRFCRLRAGSPAGTDPSGLGPCPTERQTARAADDRGAPSCRNPKAAPRRHQQVGNRPPASDRAHFSPPHSGSKVMKRPKRDQVREDRIHNEVIVDARPEEQAMGWYYYLEGKISFPFRARCLAANAVSPLRKGEAVEVLRMAVEDVCEHDMLVQIRWQGRKMAVPLSQLGAIDPDESTKEAIDDWHYWVGTRLLPVIYARPPKAHRLPGFDLFSAGLRRTTRSFNEPLQCR